MGGWVFTVPTCQVVIRERAMKQMTEGGQMSVLH